MKFIKICKEVVCWSLYFSDEDDVPMWSTVSVKDWVIQWGYKHSSHSPPTVGVFALCTGLTWFAVCLFVFRRLDISFWNYPEVSSCLPAVCQDASVKSEGGLLLPCKSLGGDPCLPFLLLLNLSTHGNAHILNTLKISQAMQTDYDSC